MKKDLQTTDEFEPIELGSVSEETKGVESNGSEFSPPEPNTRAEG